MKTRLLILSILVVFSIKLLGQEDVISGGKKSIFINTSPKLILEEPVFTDANNNDVIDAGENAFIKFSIKNTGNGLAKQVQIIATLENPGEVQNLTYEKEMNLGNLDINQDREISIPVSANENISNGLAKFRIEAIDVNKFEAEPAFINIPLKQSAKQLVINWKAPATPYIEINAPSYTIEACIESGSPISNVDVYLNDRIQGDTRGFKPVRKADCEYSVNPTLNLQEGENKIKLVVQSTETTMTSEVYTVRYVPEFVMGKRLALIIGNSEYENARKLKNPLNDATAMSDALKDLGFDVITELDADERAIVKSMDEFGNRLKNYDVGLFYYAGHGVQVKGKNFLVPVDANPSEESDVEFDCVDVGRMLGKMENAASSTNIIILDACRDNPFERGWSRSGSGQGLAMMDAPSGSLIAYATSPGKTASDGSGVNGLYTEALLEFLQKPGLQIEEVFKEVRKKVSDDSSEKQVPWESTSLTGKFYFKR